MKSLRFFGTTLAVLALAFAVGTVIGLTSGVVPNIGGIAWYLGRVLIKMSAIFLVFWLFGSVLNGRVLSTGMGDVLHAFRQHQTNQENLSPVVVSVGIMLAVAQIFVFAHAGTFAMYAYEVMTKGSIGLLIGIFVTAVIARFVGVHNLDEFSAWYHDSDNNQIVIFIMVAFNIAVFVAMLS